MQGTFSRSANNHVNNRRQAYVLLLLGVVFLAVAWLGIFQSYPVGELFFGLGILIVAPLNTHRLLAAGWLVTLIGLAGFLIFGHVIPGDQILAAHVLAIGLGLLGMTWMARRSYISSDALTPSILVVGVGVVEYLQTAHLTPAHFLSFALSLWLSGYGLLVLGLICLMMSAKQRQEDKLRNSIKVSGSGKFSEGRVESWQ